jgi:hypothetical protein
MSQLPPLHEYVRAKCVETIEQRIHDVDIDEMKTDGTGMTFVTLSVCIGDLSLIYSGDEEADNSASSPCDEDAKQCEYFPPSSQVKEDPSEQVSEEEPEKVETSNVFVDLPGTRLQYWDDGDSVELRYLGSRCGKYGWGVIYTLVDMDPAERRNEIDAILKGEKSQTTRKTALNQFVKAVEDGRVEEIIEEDVEQGE